MLERGAHGLDASRAVAGGALLSLVLALGAFAVGTAEFAAMSVVPLMARDLRISVPDAGEAIVCYAAGVCVGGPAIAALSTGRSLKRLLVGVMLFYAAANAWTAA